MSYNFNTNNAVRNMEEAGMTRLQAEAIAQTINDATMDLVTKTDLQVLRSELKQQMSELTLRLMLSQVAVAGVLFAALKLF